MAIKWFTIEEKPLNGQHVLAGGRHRKIGIMLYLLEIDSFLKWECYKNNGDYIPVSGIDYWAPIPEPPKQKKYFKQ